MLYHCSARSYGHHTLDIESKGALDKKRVGEDLTPSAMGHSHPFLFPIKGVSKFVLHGVEPL